MKLAPRDIESQVRTLNPAYVAVLIYGRDEGLVRERAQKISQQVVEDLSDPFRVANIAPDKLKAEPGMLGDEAAAISMMGGRRVVRIDGAGENATAALKEFLANPVGDSLIVVTAGGLRRTAGLVKLFEGAKNAASMACYEDNQQALQNIIYEVMRDNNLNLAPDAMAYLQANLGSDRMISRGELEKLALYMGAQSGSDQKMNVTLEDAAQCVGDSGALTLDMIASATTGGDLKKLDSSIFKAFNRGENAISILRSVARRLQKLHFVRGGVEKGIAADQSMTRIFPRMFGPEASAFKTQVSRWNSGRLANAIEIISEAEESCKITGLPPEAICARACLRIANAARG